MITRSYSPDVTTAEDAETEVKQIVRKGYLQGLPRAEIEKRVQKAAKAASEKVRLPSLRNAAYRSLVALGQKELNRLVYAFGRNGALAMTAIMLARRGRLTPDAAPREGVVFRNIAERIGRLDGDYETSAAGIPKRIYSKEYMKDVRREFLRFADEQGLDPDEMPNAKVRHSLVAKAEMEVRYQAHMENIEDLRRGGHNLVVCSVHADCSDRCSRWQGRVYSLDGTSGVTLDGKRQFVPLEKATDIYYTTKAGKTYKNGLLGFNCRHHLYPYREDMAIPYVSKEKQVKERAINEKQREYERRIRLYRERALSLREIDPKLAEEYSRKAGAEYKAYKAFSHANGRAYYPDRVKILF